MNGKKTILILQAVVCIVLALWLAVGAVAIWIEGSARKAEDPLESIYTAENVGARLGQILPAILLSLCLMAAGILLGILNGGAWDVLVKGTSICTECVGLG